jgi:hypothetical protein
VKTHMVFLTTASCLRCGCLVECFASPEAPGIVWILDPTPEGALSVTASIGRHNLIAWRQNFSPAGYGPHRCPEGMTPPSSYAWERFSGRN